MTGPVVSVVTPVYNGEEYLAECIESVLAQTWPHWRYCIVNNCSTDGSLALAESFAARDPRIRVVNNDEFLGQVENLNRAMTMVDPDSTWTKMVLADDWIFPSCLERMVQAGEAHASIGIVGSYRLDDQRVNCDGLPWPSHLVHGKELGRATLVDRLFVSGTPTTLLYRSDLVRGREPFFPTGGFHEDTELFLELLAHHDFGFVHEVLSFTRRENESLTSAIKLFDPEHRLDKLATTMNYGPRFLEGPELEACRQRDLDAYYDFLGRRCQYRTPPGFWAHQHAGLARAGLELERARFLRHWLRGSSGNSPTPEASWPDCVAR